MLSLDKQVSNIKYKRSKTAEALKGNEHIKFPYYATCGTSKCLPFKGVLCPRQYNEADTSDLNLSLCFRDTKVINDFKAQNIYNKYRQLGNHCLKPDEQPKTCSDPSLPGGGGGHYKNDRQKALIPLPCNTTVGEDFKYAGLSLITFGLKGAHHESSVVNTCTLNTDNQDVINYYDPLRAELYKDSKKETTLNTDDPNFEVNIQKMFKCCDVSGGQSKKYDVNDKIHRETCGGYLFNLFDTAMNGKDRSKTNCDQTIIKYCTDPDHPERLMRKNSYCQNWAKEGHMNDVADTLVSHCSTGYKKGIHKPVKPDTKKFNSVFHKDYEDACACYMPPGFYTDHKNHIYDHTSEFTNSGYSKPICSYHKCLSSNWKPDESNEIVKQNNKAVHRVGLLEHCRSKRTTNCVTGVSIDSSGRRSVDMDNSHRCAERFENIGKSEYKYSLLIIIIIIMLSIFFYNYNI